MRIDRLCDNANQLKRSTACELLACKAYLQEQETKEDVVDTREDPGENKTHNHQRVHRRVSPCRIPQRLAVPQRTFVSLHQAMQRE